jgi:hypothetical protein
LNYNDYSPAWHCGSNKIYVCHNDNNPQTICIDANSLLPAHYSHGDILGPCTSCAQNLIRPGNPDPVENAFQFRVTEQIDSEFDASGHPFNNLVLNSNGDKVFFVIPNPADDHIEVQTSLYPGVISLMDISGKVVHQQVLSSHNNTVNTGSLIDGIYFIRLENGTDCHIKSIGVMH